MRKYIFRSHYILVLAVLVSFQVSARGLTAADSEGVNPQYEHAGIYIPAAHAGEGTRESVSLEVAEKYLEDASTAWSGKHQCISCHTNGTYMTIRPALSRSLGAPNNSERTFFVEQLNKMDGENPKKLQRGTAPAQVIYLAAGLAEWDAHVTGQLSAETDRALRLMFSLQREHGSWGTEDCWPPYESDAYHLASVAVMAVATAPGWLAAIDKEQDHLLLAQINKLKKYLRGQPPHDYGRTLLLWAAGRMPELLSDAEKKKLIQLLLEHQQDDGGWSLRTMAEPEVWGSGNRAEKLRAEANFGNPASDGHMTGLAIIVLRDAGLPSDAPQIGRGLEWLRSNQRKSGRWWTRSLNTDRAHYITYSGTAFPLLALQMCSSDD
jgi:squalene-hopene/tetraprenyl-beta-curcumene cyclase